MTIEAVEAIAARRTRWVRRGTLPAALAAPLLLLGGCSARPVRTPEPAPPRPPLASDHGIRDAPAPGAGPSVRQETPPPGAPPAPSAGGWTWPIAGEISSRFGARDHGGGGWHGGLDLRAPEGTPVKAAKAGTVTFSGRQGQYGLLVIVDHGQGETSWYAHLGATRVREGQAVAQGQVLGTCGRTGNATGFHLHFEIRQNGVPFDPLPALGCVTGRCDPPSP